MLSKIFTLLFIIFTLLLGSFSARAYTFTASATGNWNSSGTWTRSGTGSGNTIPGATDAVVIPSSFTVTVNVTNGECASLTFQAGGANGYTMMSFSSATSQLTVSGAVTLGEISNNNRTKTLNIGAGKLIAGSVSMTNPTADSRDTRILISTGSLTVSGDITMNGSEARNYIEFTGAGVLNLAGQFMPLSASSTNGGGINPSTTSVINFNSTTEQQTFPNSVAKLGSNNYDIDVNNTYITGADNNGDDGFRLNAAVTFDVLDIGNINGAALFDENTFATFSGNVVMSGTSKMIIRGASVAAFNAGDVFNTGTTVEYASNSSQSINLGTGTIPFYHLILSGSGTKSIVRSSSGTFAVAGNLTYDQTSTTSYTNVTAIDLAGNFEGTASISSSSIPITIAGNWTNAATGTISGQVTYDGTGNQIVDGDLTYINLIFTGSGTNTITRSSTGTFAVNGNWTIGIQPNYTNVNLIDVGGNIAGTSFINSGAIPINIDGNWDNTGAGIITGLVTYNSTSAQNVSANIRYDGGLTLSGTGAKAIIRATSGAFDVRGVFTQNSPISSYHANVSFLDFDGDYNGNQFINSGNLLIYMLRDWNNTANGVLTGLVRYDKIGGTQVVSGNVQYKDLTIEAGGTKIINAVEAKVTGVVTITGNTTFNTNNNLTLVQTASSMASIAAIPAGSSIIGNVNVEIYLSGGSDSRGTRMMTSPINDAALVDKTYKQLKNYILITGSTGTDGGFDEGGTVSPFAKTLQLYNEPGPASPASASFSDITDINTPATVGEGFFVFFRGDRTTSVTEKLNGPVFPTPESVTVRFTGPVNTGQIVRNLSYTNHSNAKDGYNAVGNPYPSPISWESVTKTANVGDVITVIRRGGLGAATYDRGTNTSVNGGSEFLQPGQGFYVQASAAGQSITFEEAHKVSTAPPSRLLSTPIGDNVLGGGLPGDNVLMGGPTDNYTPPSFKRLTMNIQDAVNKDEAAIVFMPGAQKKSTLEDGQYFQGSTVVLSSLSSDGVAMAINKFPEPGQTDTVRLNVNSPANNSVKLNFTEFLGLENHTITLIDNYLSKSVNVRENPVYSFTINRSVAATFGSGRFMLVFQAPSVSLNSFTAEQIGQTAKLDWVTANELQSIKYEVERSTDGVNFTKIGELNGAGTTTQISNYTFTDQNPVYGENYYRFKQYDASNRVVISAVLQLTFAPPPAIVLSSFAAVKSDNSVKLNWTTSSEFQSQKFEIERSTDGTNFLKIGEVNGAGNSTQTSQYTFTDNAPVFGSNHYRLKHYNISNQTSFSQIVQVTIPVPPSLVLDSFTGQRSAGTGVLNWKTSGEYQSLKFEVERSADGTNFTGIGQMNGAGASNDVNTYTFIDANPLKGINYYRLKHYTTTAEKILDPVVSLNFSTPSESMLNSFSGRSDNGKAVLNWKTGTITETVSFEVERSTDNGANFFQIGFLSSIDEGVALPNFEFTDEKPEYTVNHYRLRYYTSSGTEQVSSVVQLNFPPPPAILLISFTAVKQDRRAILNWSTSSEYRSVRFEVQNSTDGSNFKTIDIVQGRGTTDQSSNYSYTHAQPEYGLNYYRLVHFDESGQVLTSVVLQLNFPPPPAMVLSSFTVIKQGDSANLNWATSSEYRSRLFEVQNSTDGSNFKTIYSVAGAGTTDQSNSYSYTHAQPEYTLNYYRLVHYDESGQVLMSSVLQMNFPPPPSMVLVGFSGKKVNGSSELSWTTSSEYQSVRFDVERSADGVNFLVIGSVNGSGTTNQSRSYVHIDKLPQFGMNYYRLKHYDNKGQIILSNDLLLNFDAPGTGIHQEVKLYPNPVTETLYASFGNPPGSNLIVSVIDVQSGKKQYTETMASTNTVSLDVKDLRSGIYLLEIREALSGKLLVREKFIKN